MRVLGIDFGQRIGTAIGETAHGVVTPRKAIASTGTLAKDALAVGELARKEEVELIVLGLPLSQGEETRMSRVCRQFGDKLTELGLSVRLVDESLTSREAEGAMLAAGLKGSQVKRALDSEAACRIVERYMEEHGEEGL